MAIAKESFGTMPDGTEVYRYTLINKNKVSASFITLGGVWVSMVVPDKDGIPGDVVLGYDDLDSYRTVSYTHLDVYKRQTLKQGIWSGCPSCILPLRLHPRR